MSLHLTQLCQGNLRSDQTSGQSPVWCLHHLSTTLGVLRISALKKHIILLWLMFRHSAMSDSLWPRGLQHARLVCPTLAPRACSDLLVTCGLDFLCLWIRLIQACYHDMRSMTVWVSNDLSGLILSTHPQHQCSKGGKARPLDIQPCLCCLSLT